MDTHHALICVAYGAGGRQGGAHTPRTLNSLTAIDGQEGEEEDWEREMRDLRDEDGVSAFLYIVGLIDAQNLL